MTDEPQDEPTQDTPKGETIPVPTGKDVSRDSEKVAKPKREKDGTGSS